MAFFFVSLCLCERISFGCGRRPAYTTPGASDVHLQLESMRSSVIIVNEKANWVGPPNAISRVWGLGSGRHKVRQAAAFLHQQGLYLFSVS